MPLVFNWNDFKVSESTLCSAFSCLFIYYFVIEKLIHLKPIPLGVDQGWGFQVVFSSLKKFSQHAFSLPVCHFLIFILSLKNSSVYGRQTRTTLLSSTIGIIL